MTWDLDAFDNEEDFEEIEPPPTKRTAKKSVSERYNKQNKEQKIYQRYVLKKTTHSHTHTDARTHARTHTHSKACSSRLLGHTCLAKLGYLCTKQALLSQCRVNPPGESPQVVLSGIGNSYMVQYSCCDIVA